MPTIRVRVVVSMMALGALAPRLPAQTSAPSETRIIVASRGWELVGDLLMPSSARPVPAVLMLNQAAGNRTAYIEVARRLVERGVASLRLDLRGHGESVNLGRFVPGEVPRSPMIWDAEQDVLAAREYLKGDSRIDPDRIGVVGSSYSGEEMAEAGRLGGFARAYVALSPGSFTDQSIDGIDASGVPWLFIVSRDERYLQEITLAVRQRSRTVELLVVPGTDHASNLLATRPDLAERVATWLTYQLR